MRIIEWVRAGNKIGNFERHNLLFAKRCQELGFNVVFMSDVENTIPEYLEGLKKAGSYQVFIGETRINPIISFNKAIKFIKYWNPDIVHTHFINPLSIPILKILKIPVIYKTYHSGIEHSISLRTRIIFRMDSLLTTRCFAVSNSVKEQIIQGGGISGQIKTINNGIDLNYIKQNHKINEPYPPGINDPTKEIIVSIGRFFKVKGMRYVTEAAIKVVQTNRNFIWWLIGKDGPEKEYCLNIVQKAGLNENIFFLGERHDILGILKYAKINVMGSLVEGLAGVALEASACGVPTIGTQVGGINDVVIDNESGILVPARSSTLLANAVLSLFEDNKLRETFSKKSKEIIEEKFDSNFLINEQLNYYINDFESYLKKCNIKKMEI